MTHSERQKHRGDEEVVKDLCAANGVSYERAAQDGAGLRSLEAFFSGFPRMVGLSLFPALQQLTVLGQDVEHVEGLQDCPLLRELWVAECRLTVISGLQSCLQLRKLYLYDNDISEIANLESQVNLEVLWLNNNRIARIQGLNTLQSLKELNLADNIIEKIGHSLDHNVSLENLNLSGNKISSFKELTPLASLLHLKELALMDPTSRPNPVCLLFNYATHVLFHAPGLRRLDTYDVSGRQIKEAAESTVMKKMMYYNMRVRGAQRTLAETRRSLTERKGILLQFPEESVRTLTYVLKDLERELAWLTPQRSAGGEPAFANSVNSDPDTDDSLGPVEPKILLKMEKLKERLRFWTGRLQEIEAWFEQELAQATNTMRRTVRFLTMELESVGNVRLEEGSATDSWFSSCSDLLLSRFSHPDYKKHGVAGVKVNRVVRIHNSALRLRFEDKLHALLATEDSGVTSKNYRRCLDHLFYAADPERSSEEDETLSIVERGFEPVGQNQELLREAVPLSNSLSVCEQPRIEYVLRHSKLRKDTFRNGQIIVSKVFVGQSMPIKEGEPMDEKIYPNVHSVYVNVDPKPRAALSEAPGDPSCSPRRRRWFVFDPELVLPEYILYFEYLFEDQEEDVASAHHTDQTSSNGVFADREAVDMEPVLKARPKLLVLDDKNLLKAARASVLSQITPGLEFLDASFNQVETLQGLRGLGKLTQLHVRWNRLSNAREEAAALRKHAPALLHLDARHNCWKRPAAVRTLILGRLTTLTHLDDVMVTEEEAAEAARVAAGTQITQASLLTHSRAGAERPRSLSLLPTVQLLCVLSPAPWGLSRELEPNWTSKITALNLDSQRISKLINLERLENLRWASFNDNDISKVEGLGGCVRLEELSLNDNSISTLTGLSNLHCLIKLSVDRNQLSALEQLPGLSFLSVESNCINSLRGIQGLRSLCELYAANNHISTSRDIYHLKGLTNIIILDLYGNPLLEKLENYRIYVVFHVPSLKALDGIAVEMNESESAKDIFGGRLNPDMVAERLGHSSYTDITFLSLQSCSIRVVDLSPAEAFSNLRSLNLDHNGLTSFSGLVYLPSIKALSLNYNHIESILPRQKVHLTNRQLLYSKVHSSGYGQQSSSRPSREAGATASLEPLMGSLEVLHLSHNGISNMANLQLSRLTNLKALFLQGNEISQVEGLEGLHQLRELVLDRNRIKALAETSFAGQGALLQLHLAENRVRELNHLHPLTELRKLFLGLNKLQDITELDKLDVLPSLTELSVIGNPVARNSLHRPAVVLRLTRLQVLDGMVVTLEERTRAELLHMDPSPCSQHCGGSLPTAELNLPGLLLPLVPPNPLLRGTSLSGGLQHFIREHSILPNNMDEAPSYTYKQKKHKCSNAARSTQTDVSFRRPRRTGSSLPTPGPLSDGNRGIITYPSQEQDSRFPSGSKPPTM
ncbi:leucine-rich repeat-containing protein 9 isoform X2 [Betta splendens]|uniref:Leucine-rich repeat-containing protein 9 isoform X2 n=1 Tax=Betta splendens TaxID=158456 RepID=A0A8M1H9R5_BETSP|nr:leucine-rich repeat-containing protein 9 isoform X2 [Betta splendens]